MLKQFLGPQIHIGRLKKLPFFEHQLLFCGILNWVMVLHLDLLGARKVWLVTQLKLDITMIYQLSLTGLRIALLQILFRISVSLLSELTADIGDLIIQVVYLRTIHIEIVSVT